MYSLVTKGGPLMWPILFCSVAAAAIALRKALQFRSAYRCVTMDLKQAVAERPPFLAPVIEAVARGAGEEDVAGVGTRQVRALERGLGSLSLISAISPLLGLTGTVIGMIQAFQVIAGADSAVDPAMLASGIWEALITTAAGLLVAIPVHVAHHYLDARMGEIIFNFQEMAAKLLRRRA